MENKTKCYCNHTDYCDCAPLEELKQETLEEAAFNFTAGKSVKEICSRMDFVKGSKFGAKWQQKQDKKLYSEEEVLEIIDLLFHRYASSFRIDAKEYFLQFKKK